MRFLKRLAAVFWATTLTTLSLSRAVTVLALSPPVLAAPVGLSLAELKITGNEFVMLQNNSGAAITDLSQYWLYDFNNVNPMAAGVNSSTQQLPAGSLDDGQTLLLSSTGGATCGAAITAKLGVSLTDSGGFLQVVKTSLVNNSLVQTGGDAVSWSSGINAVPGMISKVPSGSSDPAGAWYRYQNVVPSPPFLWQQADVDATNSCQLDVVINSTPTPGPVNPGNQLLPGVPPAARFITLTASSSGTGPSMPTSDKGLMSPVVTELLPNPGPPKTDANDEFVELYNPNRVSFDLSGFKIQTESVESTTPHVYTIASGTKIPAKSFLIFSSGDTSISLNNSGGEAWLLDPFNHILSHSDAYDTAKEGQSWSLGNGKWYWTSAVTPNTGNVIAITSSANSSQLGNSYIPGVAGASTTASNSSNSPKSNNGQTNPSSKSDQSVHPLLLVGIALLALLYWAYEYRKDIINFIYKFRQSIKNRIGR